MGAEGVSRRYLQFGLTVTLRRGVYDDTRVRGSAGIQLQRVVFQIELASPVSVLGGRAAGWIDQHETLALALVHPATSADWMWMSR